MGIDVQTELDGERATGGCNARSERFSCVAHMPIDSGASIRRVLTALDTRLAAEPATEDLVVVGESALLAMGLVERATQDVDVVALVDDELLTAEQLPTRCSARRLRSRATLTLRRTGSIAAQRSCCGGPPGRGGGSLAG
jgi:hypothetical protein